MLAMLLLSWGTESNGIGAEAGMGHLFPVTIYIFFFIWRVNYHGENGVVK